MNTHTRKHSHVHTHTTHKHTHTHTHTHHTHTVRISAYAYMLIPYCCICTVSCAGARKPMQRDELEKERKLLAKKKPGVGKGALTPCQSTLDSSSDSLPQKSWLK